MQLRVNKVMKNTVSMLHYNTATISQGLNNVVCLLLKPIYIYIYNVLGKTQ